MGLRFAIRETVTCERELAYTYYTSPAGAEQGTQKKKAREIK